MTGKPAITGYDLQYRMKGATDWIDHPFTGTTTRDVVSGLTPETEYEARVRAANAEGTGDWSAPGSGKTADEDVPEKPDAPSVSASESHPKTRLNVSWSAPENEGPPIKTYMLRYREQGTDDEWSLRSTEKTSDVLVRLSPGTTYEVQVRATNAKGHGAWSDSGVGATAGDPADKDEEEDDKALDIVLAVAENSPAGAVVGRLAEITDGSGAARAHLFTPSAQFVFDPASRRITVAPGADLDYEAVPVYNLTVLGGQLLDTAGKQGLLGDADPRIMIRVVDVDEPPAKPGAPSVVAAPVSPTSAVTVSWSAPATTGPAITGYDLRYRKQGAAEWTTHPVDGTAASALILGLKKSTRYEAQVRGVNAEGAGDWSDIGAGLTATRANAAPAFPSTLSAIRKVAENSPAGTPVGALVTATDPDGDALTYALVGAREFTIDAATGQISVAQGASLDYEAVRSYSVTVSVADGLDALGNPDSAPDHFARLTILITDVDEGGLAILSIVNPGDKTYRRGETIEPFAIEVTGGEATVSLTGLPAGLSYGGGAVSGTVSDEAPTGAYDVTITAVGVNDEATETFEVTITVTDAGVVLPAGDTGVVDRVSIWLTVPMWAMMLAGLGRILMARRMRPLDALPL